MYGRRQAGHLLLLICLLVVVIVAIIAIGLFLFGQQRPGRLHQTTPASAVQQMVGISISPSTYTAAGLKDFFGRASQLHGAVLWQGDWQELNEVNTGATLVTNNAATYSYTPVVVVTAFKDSGKSQLVPIRSLNDATIVSYVSRARSYAAAHHPSYFGIGIEVNRIYETSPSDYQSFVTLFNQAAAAVHDVSSATKVFTTFQLERMSGYRGGLYGGVNDASQAEWKLLADFSAADIIGFTSYPGIIFKSPDDIPADYYQSAASHAAKPIIFTELGWPAADEVAGWPSSPEVQNHFVEIVQQQTSGQSVQLSIWSFLYDQAVSVPFNHLGLLNTDGTARPASETFSKLRE